MRIAPVAFVIVSLAFAFACTPPRDDASRSPAPATPATPERPVERDRSGDPVTVQFHVVGEVPRKPPLLELQVDVTILNHASEPRWVLLPRQAGHKPADGGGVDVLEVERWGDIRVANWLGTGGFRAVRIGADARIALDRMTVQWWRDDPARPTQEDRMRMDLSEPPRQLEAVAVRALVIDGKRAETYFESDPTVPAPGAGGSKPEVIATVRHRTDHAEVAVELLEPIDVHYAPWPRD